MSTLNAQGQRLRGYVLSKLEWLPLLSPSLSVCCVLRTADCGHGGAYVVGMALPVLLISIVVKRTAAFIAVVTGVEIVGCSRFYLVADATQ